MLHADFRGILAFIAVAMCWAFAVVLFRAGERGSVARKLALLMVVESIGLGSSGSIEFLFGPLDDFYRRQPWFTLVEMILHVLGDAGMLVLYPPFLAVALQTPLSRPFAGRGARIAIGIGAAMIFLALVFPLAVNLLNSTPPDFPRLAAPAGILYVLMSALFAFAFIASLDAWRRSTGAARKRARIFAIAFGIRDVCWGLVYVIQVWELWNRNYDAVFVDSPWWMIVYTFGTFTAVPLIAYGILRTQLFDIDLRIRWTIKQSTLAAAVVAMVYVLSEGASRLLSNELGNFAGLLAAAVVVFFLAPLQRFAERVARVAMPNTHNTPEYATFRKLGVYEAAVAEALPGGITDKERALLRRLQDSLGISAIDAASIERDIQARERAAGDSVVAQRAM
ncbi:MAG: hypothetical protein ABI846_04000 [Rudaea sp.]